MFLRYRLKESNAMVGTLCEKHKFRRAHHELVKGQHFEKKFLFLNSVFLWFFFQCRYTTRVSRLISRR